VLGVCAAEWKEILTLNKKQDGKFYGIGDAESHNDFGKKRGRFNNELL
jgi:hypothetical protein